MTQQRSSSKPTVIRPWMGTPTPSTNKAKRAKRCRCGASVTISDEAGKRCAACAKAVE